MFINLTNHPSSKWQNKQVLAAQKFGTIVDLPFPQIDPYADESSINALVAQYYQMVLEKKPQAVLVAGEFTFVYQLVNALLSAGILVVSACSVRNTRESLQSDGTLRKEADFDFVAFRMYQNYVS